MWDSEEESDHDKPFHHWTSNRGKGKAPRRGEVTSSDDEPALLSREQFPVTMPNRRKSTTSVISRQGVSSGGALHRKSRRLSEESNFLAHDDHYEYDEYSACEVPVGYSSDEGRWNLAHDDDYEYDEYSACDVPVGNSSDDGRWNDDESGKMRSALKKRGSSELREDHSVRDEPRGRGRHEDSFGGRNAELMGGESWPYGDVASLRSEVRMSETCFRGGDDYHEDDVPQRYSWGRKGGKRDCSIEGRQWRRQTGGGQAEGAARHIREDWMRRDVPEGDGHERMQNKRRLLRKRSVLTMLEGEDDRVEGDWRRRDRKLPRFEDADNSRTRGSSVRMQQRGERRAPVDEGDYLWQKQYEKSFTQRPESWHHHMDEELEQKEKVMPLLEAGECCDGLWCGGFGFCSFVR